MCNWEFVIATTDELTKDSLGQALISTYGPCSFNVREATNYIYERIADIIIEGEEDFEAQYEFFQEDSRKEDIVDKVDNKGFKFFYFGNVSRMYSWLRDIEVNNSDIVFCVSQIMV